MERCEKELKVADVKRLSVTKEMLKFLPLLDPKCDIPISVLDDWNKSYVFYLSSRDGKYKRPPLDENLGLEVCKRKRNLTACDVKRLSVTKEMLAFMPPIDPDHDIPIRVLDDWGKSYVFYLSCRQGYKNPVFQSKHWTAFVKERGAKAGEDMYFWREENTFYQTQYRIKLLKSFL
ncbi:unnamed protein product [Prunus brigantina]